MKTYLSILALLFTLAHCADSRAQENCSRYCDPNVSIPCGNGCISKHLMCTKDWTTACTGTRQKAKKQYFKTPKKVDKAPSG